MALSKIKNKKDLMKDDLKVKKTNSDQENDRINSIVDSLNGGDDKMSFFKKTFPMDRYTKDPEIESEEEELGVDLDQDDEACEPMSHKQALLEKKEELVGEDLDGDDEEGESPSHKQKVLGKRGLFSDDKKTVHIMIGLGKGGK